MLKSVEVLFREGRGEDMLIDCVIQGCTISLVGYTIFKRQ